MLEIMLDVNGWQGLFDFRTGEPVEEDGKTYLDIPRKICRENPYPGDTNPESVLWTTDMALSICREYDPQLMVLGYATGNIMRINTEMSAEEQHALSRLIVSEGFRFAKEAGYEPVIISNGGLKPFEKILNTEDIEGYLSDSPDRYMAGIFNPSEKDLETVKHWPGVTCETRETFVMRYGITDPYVLERTPGIILYSDADTAFTKTGNRGITFHMTSIKKKTCLGYTELPGLPESIFDFRAYVDGLLAEGRKIAVIIVESVDDEDMPAGSKELRKHKNGIYYSESLSFYYALLNGKEFFEPGMPYIFHNQFLRRPPEKRYPYSYIKSERFQEPIGYHRSFKTASMGTRSGILHSSAMCDYSFECHCRSLAESGLLVFVNGDKLGTSSEQARRY